MTDPRDFNPQEELSAAEKRAFAALPREMDPPEGLEERAVAMLRRAGHLPTPITLASRRQKSTKTWWVTGAVAAALAVFASGMALGQYVGMNKAERIVSARTAAEANNQVQRTGDRYIAALASLGQLRDTSDIAGRTRAKETALAVLGAAAEEIAQLAPDDPLAAAVLRGLDERSRAKGSEAPSRSVIWY
jgi:hypothetical protein